MRDDSVVSRSVHGWVDPVGWLRDHGRPIDRSATGKGLGFAPSPSVDSKVSFAPPNIEIAARVG